MNVVQQSSKTINLFDRYRLILPPALKHHQDGLPGKRVLFITDCDESFDISFEEDMECRDLTAGGLDRERTVCFEHRSGDQYIHQRRIDRRSTSFAFFHIELKDSKGKTVCLPGQMIADQNYMWSEDVEPILIKLLDGISIQ